jgi:hypothetical protein
MTIRAKEGALGSLADDLRPAAIGYRPKVQLELLGMRIRMVKFQRRKVL